MPEEIKDLQELIAEEIKELAPGIVPDKSSLSIGC